MIKMPAEWEEQEFVQLVFPHENTDWLEYLDDAVHTFVNIAKTISKYQKCLIITKNINSIKSLFNSDKNLQFIELDSNDTWSRDLGGISVYDNGKRKVLDFSFNGWGCKYAHDKDNIITKKLNCLGIFKDSEFETIDFVLEGGSVESDGNGTVMTTSRCLLEKNRNPQLAKEEITQRLKKYLGAKQVLWLEYGYLAGDDTDSHIDTLARFANENTIIYQSCDDKEDEHYEELKKMESELQDFTNIHNQKYTLAALPWISPKFHENERLPATYANFLIINGAVLVPVYNDKNDSKAVEIFKDIFPDRDIIAVDCTTLIKQHGSLHCVTMQYPKREY